MWKMRIKRLLAIWLGDITDYDNPEFFMSTAYWRGETFIIEFKRKTPAIIDPATTQLEDTPEAPNPE